MLKEDIKLITPLSHGLPKTGQITSYAAGDDGEIEAGWWPKRLITNNKNRYLVKILDTDDVVVDLATGLMWAGDGDAEGCGWGTIEDWGFLLAHLNGLSFATFSDWRLPNIQELFSLLQYTGTAPFIAEPPFTNTKTGRYWSSTTRPDSTTQAMTVDFQYPRPNFVLKTEKYYCRGVRGGI